MRDRQPLRPNRVLVTPEDGSAPFYATITRADEPVDEGDPLNKFTFLKDETAKMLGGDPKTMVPDDALQRLTALASSGGSGSGDAGALEDLTVKVGRLINAGAGWNTYKFPDPLEAAPQAVLLQPVEFTGWIEVRDITAEGFLYCLRQDGSKTTADPVEVIWLAVEFNGGDD